jgi:methionyl-tRNA formyltransferase
VTIHETVAALDAGQIAAQEEFPLGDLDAGAVFERSGAIAAHLLDEVLESPVFVPQPEEGATYAEKITPADRELNLDDPLDSWRRVRALSPHIGAWTTLHGRRVTIWRALLEEGVFVPELVQPEGRGMMSYDEFERGVR